ELHTTEHAVQIPHAGEGRGGLEGVLGHAIKGYTHSTQTNGEGRDGHLSHLADFCRQIVKHGFLDNRLKFLEGSLFVNNSLNESLCRRSKLLQVAHVLVEVVAGRHNRVYDVVTTHGDSSERYRCHTGIADQNGQRRTRSPESVVYDSQSRWNQQGTGRCETTPTAHLVLKPTNKETNGGELGHHTACIQLSTEVQVMRHSIQSCYGSLYLKPEHPSAELSAKDNIFVDASRSGSGFSTQLELVDTRVELYFDVSTTDLTSCLL